MYLKTNLGAVGTGLVPRLYLGTRPAMHVRQYGALFESCIGGTGIYLILLAGSAFRIHARGPEVCYM